MVLLAAREIDVNSVPDRESERADKQRPDVPPDKDRATAKYLSSGSSEKLP